MARNLWLDVEMLIPPQSFQSHLTTAPRDAGGMRAAFDVVLDKPRQSQEFVEKRLGLSC